MVRALRVRAVADVALALLHEVVDQSALIRAHLRVVPVVGGGLTGLVFVAAGAVAAVSLRDNCVRLQGVGLRTHLGGGAGLQAAAVLELPGPKTAVFGG